MATINLHTGIFTSPKFIPLSDGAYRLWSHALMWSKEHLTDGFIPAGMLPSLHRQAAKFAPELLRVTVPGKGPLWHQDGDGYRIHDFADWQDDATTVQTRRRKWRDQKRGIRTSSTAESKVESTPESNTESREGVGGGVGGGCGGGVGTVSVAVAPEAREPKPSTVIPFDDAYGASPAKRRKAHIAWEAKRDILDIPHDLYAELLSGMPTSDESALRAWLAEVESTWTGRGVAPAYKFWRARAEERWGEGSGRASVSSTQASAMSDEVAHAAVLAGFAAADARRRR